MTWKFLAVAALALKVAIGSNEDNAIGIGRRATMFAAFLVLSYLIGSIPVAWLVTRALTGNDLRRLGSGNVGVMNVMVSVARWAGVLVFLAEAGKGLLVVILAHRWFGTDLSAGMAALAAFTGTRWMVWLRGSGGRGNTLAGTVLLALSWPALLVVLAIWFLTRCVTGRSFIATRASLVALPLVLGLITQSIELALVGVGFSALFLATHRLETDDHMLIKDRWDSLLAFLTGPPRSGSHQSGESPKL
jgi:glycerol-3-phosphate acyltransferase PlsY